mmetsp:Transcript_43474/g.170046  ORF Transcript_43474/g.170046 Transcript_43474/m.170046 type:complete len:94 (-) Transcript_43474:927-1208(-)
MKRRGRPSSNKFLLGRWCLIDFIHGGLAWFRSVAEKAAKFAKKSRVFEDIHSQQPSTQLLVFAKFPFRYAKALRSCGETELALDLVNSIIEAG